MEDEATFLRRIIIRLRGTSVFPAAPEIGAVLKEIITEAEDRLVALDEAELPRLKGLKQ